MYGTRSDVTNYLSMERRPRMNLLVSIGKLYCLCPFGGLLMLLLRCCVRCHQEDRLFIIYYVHVYVHVRYNKISLHRSSRGAAGAWKRNRIDNGHQSPAVRTVRTSTKLSPNELFNQCHMNQTHWLFHWLIARNDPPRTRNPFFGKKTTNKPSHHVLVASADNTNLDILVLNAKLPTAS